MKLLPEQLARIKIDKQLNEAGWDIVSREEYIPNHAQAVKEALMSGTTESDYLLFIDNKAIAVVEAKREENNLGDDVAIQAEDYANNPRSWYGLWFDDMIPLVYLANGKKILFKNLLEPDSDYVELDQICNKKELSEEKEKLEKSLAEQVEKIQELIDMNSRVAQNQEKYKKEYDAMIKTYDETKFKYEQLEIESSQQAAKHQMIKDYINTLKKQNKPLTKFDGLMWGSLLESATIKDKDTIVFKFKDGTEING